MLTGFFNKSACPDNIWNVMGACDAPVGEMALRLGLISFSVKNALLVAQAAVRTFRLAETGGQLAEDHEGILQSHFTGGAGFDPSAYHMAEWNDGAFAYVGSERDTLDLKAAQSTQVAAQMYFNHEVRALSAAIHGRSIPSLGAVAREGFRRAAAEFCAKAAQLLKAEGHEKQASDIQGLSDHLMTFVSPVPTLCTPAQTLERYVSLNALSPEADQRLRQLLNFIRPVDPSFKEEAVYNPPL